MFHRVKSETPTEADQVTETPVEETEEVQAEAETVDLEETLAEDEEAKQTEESQTEEEDTEEMTDTTETAQEETQYTATTQQTYGARPAQPAASTGGYPGAYPGAASYAASNTPSETESYSDRTLTIGPGITMSGEIEACDNLVVEGTVEAALKGASNLDITETGTFFGSVEIEEATIAGRFEGELTVTGRLTVKSGGVIAGSIVYGELEIEAGSLIDGRMTPIAAGQSAQQSAPKTPSKTAAAKAKLANSPQQQPANTDGELFAEQA